MRRIAYAALWIYVFSVPWGGVVVISSGTNIIGRVTGGAAVGLALFTALFSGRFRRWHAFHLAALLFVVWAGCTQLYFYQGGGDRLPNKFWTYVQLLLVLWIMWELAASKQRQLGLLAAYVSGAYVAAFGTILLLRRAEALRRLALGGADPNDIAMTLALALPMAWYLGLTYRRPFVRWICRAYIPVGLVAIALTGSRGGMITGLAAMAIVPFTMTRLTPTRLATAVAALGLSGALAVIYVPDKIVQRLATTGTSVENLSLGGRFSIWVAAVRAFAQRPVVGYGTGSFRTAVRPYGIEQVAHNSYLSVLVEQGLVGFLLYYAMFVAALVSVVRLPLLERRFALILLGTLSLAMFPLTWEDQKAAWFVLAALIGLGQAARPAAGPAPRRRAVLVPTAPRGARPRTPLGKPGPAAPQDATT